MDELRQIGQALAAHNNEVGLLHGVHDDRPSTVGGQVGVGVVHLDDRAVVVGVPEPGDLACEDGVGLAAPGEVPIAAREAPSEDEQLADALADLTKELAKLDRYERRARSRRKSAIGRYTAS
jgi:hypothetical protein